MPSLTVCLSRAGDLLPPDVRAAILRRVEELRKEGGTDEPTMARRAIADVQAQQQASRQEVESAMRDGRTLYEPAAPREEGEGSAGAAPTDKALATEMDQAAAQLEAMNPEMPIMVDGMDAPIPLREYMAQVRNEAAADLADAPLLEVAAACAIRTGTAAA